MLENAVIAAYESALAEAEELSSVEETV